MQRRVMQPPQSAGSEDKDEISDLLDRTKFKSLNQRLQGMVEDLSKRLREERESFLAYKTEKDNNEQGSPIPWRMPTRSCTT